MKLKKFINLLKLVGLDIQENIAELIFTIAIHVNEEIDIYSVIINNWVDEIHKARVIATMNKFESVIDKHCPVIENREVFIKELVDTLMVVPEDIINDKLLKDET